MAVRVENSLSRWVVIRSAGSWTNETATLFSYRENDTNSFPNTDADGRDVINSPPTGSIAANSSYFGRRGGTFINNTPAVKARHASNEVSRALGAGCVSEYV